MDDAIPRITDFAADACNPERYAELGDGWSLAVADVISSTDLAAKGRDRAVNFVAASVVAVLSRVIGGGIRPVACQFGGDGAVVAVPPGFGEAAARSLAALAHWAKESVGIPLRVGLVPVASLRADGHPVLVALHDLGGGNVLGLFLGQGVIEAEHRLKSDPRCRIEPEPGELPGMEGLSCRWEPLPSRQGMVMSVIIDPVDAGPAGIAILDRVLRAIHAIAPPGMSAPLGDGGSLVPPTLPSWGRVGLEASRTTGALARGLVRFRAFLGSLLIHLAWRAGGRLGPIDATRYLRAVAHQSDHSKQGGGLRLVLDLSAEQADAIEAMLGDEEKAGAVIFGTARSDAATMTCLVGDFARDRHVHFVDGAGLGFWRASIVIKAKRSA